MKGTADEAESRAAPGKCCGYQPGADDCALLELCNVQGTFGTITPRDVFHVFLGDRCSTIEELEKASQGRADGLQTAYRPRDGNASARARRALQSTERRRELLPPLVALPRFSNGSVMSGSDVGTEA